MTCSFATLCVPWWVCLNLSDGCILLSYHSTWNIVSDCSWLLHPSMLGPTVSISCTTLWPGQITCAHLIAKLTLISFISRKAHCLPTLNHAPTTAEPPVLILPLPPQKPNTFFCIWGTYMFYFAYATFLSMKILYTMSWLVSVPGPYLSPIPYF
jgi:hypothetical protein